MSDRETMPRWVVCAAMKYEDGLIICSPRHYDGTCHAIRNRIPNIPSNQPEQGFVDQWGVFMSREEALQVAKDNGQIRRRCGGDHKELFSENLY